jgi:hypothetical protein
MGESQNTPPSTNPDEVWGETETQMERFPVELSPFMYLNTPAQLEEELVEHYGSRVKEWLYEEPHLVLVFTNCNHAH